MKRSSRGRGVVVVFATVGMLAASTSPASAVGTTAMVDVNVDGNQSNGHGAFSSTSTDGTKVAFISSASDLVAEDTNGVADIFVRDLVTGKTILVSVSSDGAQADAASSQPAISGSGRYVVFASLASNLVPNDTNGSTDVFRRDLKGGDTVLVSSGRVNSENRSLHSVTGESFLPAVSEDGQEVAFVSTASARSLLGRSFFDLNQAPDIFMRVWNRHAPDGVSSLVSHAGRSLFRAADGISGGNVGGTLIGVSISDDGKFIAFGSTATNIDTSKRDANGHGVDIFWSVKSISATLVSRAKSGIQGNFDSLTPSLSADGCAVAFWSTSTNLIVGDTNNVSDIFLKELCSDGEVLRANLKSDGAQEGGGAAPLTNSALSDDGFRVAFATFGVLTQPEVCVGEQVYVRKFDASETLRMSDTRTGQCGDRYSNYTVISGDGTTVTWTSASDSLVLGDTNADSNVFVRGEL